MLIALVPPVIGANLAPAEEVERIGGHPQTPVKGSASPQAPTEWPENWGTPTKPLDRGHPCQPRFLLGPTALVPLRYPVMSGIIANVALYGVVWHRTGALLETRNRILG